MEVHPQACSDDSTAFDVAKYPNSFLDLPTEIRLMIYALLIESKGTVTIYANHAIGKNVSRTTLCLLHINRLIRSDVEDFFYTNQAFTFRSLSAVRNFVNDVGSRRVAMVREITIDEWLASRFYTQYDSDVQEMLRQFSGLEQVSIEQSRMYYGPLVSDSAFVVAQNHRDHPHRYRLGTSGFLIMGTWENFLRGKAFVPGDSGPYWHQRQTLVLVGPGSALCTAEIEAKARKNRWGKPIFDAGSLVTLPTIDEVRAKVAKHPEELASAKAREQRKLRQRKNRVMRG